MDVEVRDQNGMVLCRGTYDGGWLHSGLKSTNTQDIGPLDVIEYGDPWVLIVGPAKTWLRANYLRPGDTLTVVAGGCTVDTRARRAR